MSPEDRSNAELAREEFDASQVERIEKLEAENEKIRYIAYVEEKNFLVKIKQLEAENEKLKNELKKWEYMKRFFNLTTMKSEGV